MLYDKKANRLLQQLHMTDKAINAALAACKAHLVAGSRNSSVAEKLEELNKRRQLILEELEDFSIGKISDQATGRSADQKVIDSSRAR